jgi:hypothetical protein
MLISYGICVCNENRELDNLLTFIKETRHPDSETVVLVDTSNPCAMVDSVIEKNQWVKRFDREFDGDFATHKNFLNVVCTGKYIFNIDADEIPQEALMYTAAQIASNNSVDVMYVPRINICPGYTAKFIKTHGFQVNDAGWINWPDYQGRIYKQDLKWVGKVHEKVYGTDVQALPSDPKYALWHVKTTNRQNSQNELYKKIESE